MSHIEEILSLGVCVTVEGPDPKELKSKYRPFYFNENGRTKLSASGVIINKKLKTVITSGALIAPFIEKPESNFDEDVFPNTKITVYFNGEGGETRAKFLTFVDCMTSDKWVYQLTQGGDWYWGFTTNFVTKLYTQYKKPTPSMFALLQVDEIPNNIPEIQFATKIMLGEKVYVVSSPFGMLCREALQNSISSGIVSNVLGVTGNYVILTDARMLPGSEHNTCIELNIGIGVEALRESIITGTEHKWVTKQGLVQSQMLKRARNSLVYIHVKNYNASGIIVGKKGYVLTNAHLFSPFLKDWDKSGIQIRVQLDKELQKREGRFYNAELVFVSKGPFDLALIKVDFQGRPVIPVKINPSQRMETGQDVYVIGFPVFHPVSGLSATITAGTLTKIVRVGGVPAQLQSDAQVHDGNSGGMLVNSNMELLGIITSNARHQMEPEKTDSPSVIIPKLNFSIPVSRMKPIVQAIEKDDMSLLSVYNSRNKAIEKIWTFKLDPPQKLQISKFYKFVEQLKKSQDNVLNSKL